MPLTHLLFCCCRTTSNAGYGSGRNSYAGSIVDPLSGSLPGSGRSSYAGVIRAQRTLFTSVLVLLPVGGVASPRTYVYLSLLTKLGRHMMHAGANLSAGISC